MSRLLIVEDNPDTRLGLRILFTRKGMTVDMAADGREALNLLSLNHYNAIILDLAMPVMNGLEMLVEARNQGITLPPVLALTGYGEARTEGVAGITATAVKGEPFEVFETKLMEILE